MIKSITSLVVLIFISLVAVAQPTSSKEQQDLERQRQQLKNELEQTQALLENSKKNTKENLSTLAHINHKLNIQGNVIDNISREINLMDNSIYKSQRDVNKLQALLDTLKQEYAKSMVYAYKNRSNSDFLNFIFSSASFNDAIKRVAYMKSYRNYREMQGENILHTQILLKDRISELSGNKVRKNTVLEVQSKELDQLQVQQEEKNKIVQKLKAQTKDLNNQLAAKKKQMQKVNVAIAAAIKRAIDDARKASAAKAAEDKRKRDAMVKTADPMIGNTKTTTVKTPKSTPAKPSNDLLPTEADVTLNASFIKNRGSLPWPVNSGYILLHFGLNKLGVGVEVNSNGISIGCDIGIPVKAVFDGEVVLVNNYDDIQMVVVKHGEYFTCYSNITGVNVAKYSQVRVGQVIGKSAANLDGVGAVDFQISKEKNEVDPLQWLKHR